jgi:hypothetical protein
MYVLKKSDVLFCQTGWSGFWSMQSAKINSAEPNLAQLNGLVPEIRWSRISRCSGN